MADTRPIVYQCDEQWFYVGENRADPSPLEPGVWLIPGRCVEVAPPAVTANERAQWDVAAKVWKVVHNPIPHRPHHPVLGVPIPTNTPIQGGDVPDVAAGDTGTHVYLRAAFASGTAQEKEWKTPVLYVKTLAGQLAKLKVAGE